MPVVLRRRSALKVGRDLLVVASMVRDGALLGDGVVAV